MNCKHPALIIVSAKILKNDQKQVTLVSCYFAETSGGDKLNRRIVVNHRIQHPGKFKNFSFLFLCVVRYTNISLSINIVKSICRQ